MRAFLLSCIFAATAVADPARIHVFVSLVDNRTQGIEPVPARIGDGDNLATNLYWGCDEALKPVLKAGAEWKLVSSVVGPKAEILERATFSHRSGKWTLIADAYRGSAIRTCTADFFAALSSDEPLASLPLVAYIGHDGLMDFQLPPEATAKRGPGRQAIVLCCKSDGYFAPHLAAVNARPLVLTTQLMYPGGFILRAVLDGWTRGEGASALCDRAAASYARNQHISAKAARAVFTTGKDR
jgi:hypothetical protein